MPGHKQGTDLGQTPFLRPRVQPTGVSLGLPPGEFVDPYTAWRALLTASYEVDLFGRVSDTVNATRSDYESNVATFRSVTLALQADVAQTYFALRATDDELRILRETVGWRDESVRLLQKRFDLGDISELDLARAKTEASNARTDAIGLERRRGELEHALAVLLGKPPAALAIEVAPLGNDLPAIPAGSAFGAARAASGHRGGDPADGCRQLAHRCCQVRVLPGAQADRGGRLRIGGSRGPLQLVEPHMAARPPDRHHPHRTDHRRRAQPRQPRARRSGLAGVRGGLPPAGAGRVSRRSRTTSSRCARWTGRRNRRRTRSSAPRARRRSQTCATTRGPPAIST